MITIVENIYSFDPVSLYFPECVTVHHSQPPTQTIECTRVDGSRSGKTEYLPVRPPFMSHDW